MGSSIRHGNSEPGTVPERHVGSPFSGWLKESEREEVGRTTDESPEGMGTIGDSFPVFDFSSASRVLKKDTDQILVVLRVSGLGA